MEGKLLRPAACVFSTYGCQWHYFGILAKLFHSSSKKQVIANVMHNADKL